VGEPPTDSAPRRSTSAGWVPWVVRTGAGVLAALHLWWGVWARLAPRSFFDTFPGLGRNWTAAYPPYNEHLVTDLGSTFLTLAFLLSAVAATTNRAVWRVVLAGVLLFSTLHIGFHAVDPGELRGADFAASVAALAAGVAIPLGLLVVDLVTSRRRRR
jgi:hypothetical protein